MKKKYVIIVCLMFLITAFSSMSIGVKMTNSDFSVRFEIDIIPDDRDIPTEDSASDPVVEITYPEDGSHLPSDYLEVLGYAMDPDGMYRMVWTYECVYGTYVDNETFDIAQYLNFRIRIFDIPEGYHIVTVIFFDIYNNSGSDSVTVYYGVNDPPEKPNRPTGPDSGAVGEEYTYETHSTDPNDDEISYGWDWDGDNVVDEWTEFYPSGEIINASHIWDFEGTYNVKVKAKDENDGESGFSSPLTVHITSNSAPSKPSTPSGSTMGRPGVSYSYTSASTDPEDDRVYYMFDWDDGTELVWEGPFESGTTVSFSHVWTAQGSFSVKVKAKDDPDGDGDLSDGMESVWSDPLPISMPKAKTFNFLESLFSRFPILKHFFFSFFT
jgi:hypothetical protein